jgi:MFS family permease
MNADQATARRRTAPGLVAALVDSGIVSAEDRSRAVEIVERELGPAGEDAPRSRVLAEIAGYAGGILVVAAGGVFLAANWRNMSTGTRVGALLAGAFLLAVAAVATRLSPSAGTSTADADVRRRLAGAFGIGAAALSAGSLGAYLESRPQPHGTALDGTVFVVLTVVAFAGYLLAPTVPGQVAVGFGLLTAFLNITADWSASWVLVKAATLILFGVGWLALAERRWWHEPETARLVGGGLLLIGAEVPVFEAHWRGAAYLLLAVIGAAAFAVYLRVRAWPYLGIGVVGLTLAATEAAVDYLPSGTGAAAGLLVAGAMLLVTSLVAMRLHRGRPAPDPSPVSLPNE